jgi:predicted metalloprotease
MGIGGTVIVLVLSLLFGRNLFDDLGTTPGAGVTTETGGSLAAGDSAREEPMVQFVSFVLDDAQRTWTRVFQANGETYRDAKLVLFRDGVQSGCGVAQSAMGPFYCPLDQKVYLDLGFFEELDRRFGAPGDFAQAYVIAHELGHHVQNLSGTADQVRQMQEARPHLANQLSVRLELQADCYAGVWAHSTEQRDLLQQGDLAEGLAAASAVGDDRIQSQSMGGVNPESFTHGTAEQRASWFHRGYESGNPSACDTFSS